jgi:integrase
MKNVIVDVFDYAIQNRAIEFNPARYLIIPSAKKQERRALFDYEQQWITDTPHRAQLPAMVMMYSGLRRGELIPLRWSSVDLSAGTITVERFVTMDKGRPIEKHKGKSDAAHRVVNIPAVLVEYLRETQKAKRPSPFELVCPSLKGGMYTDNAWKRMWDTYLQDLNIKYGKTGAKSKYDPKGVPMMIPRFTAHWLRHTFATMLYHAGIDVLTARDQLGHSDIRTTLEIYTHLDKQYKRNSMAKLDEYLSAKTS